MSDTTEPYDPDRFKATRVFGGTEIAERVLAWAGTELTRRQQHPREGDAATSERWSEVVSIFVEELDGLSERGRAHCARIAREGRTHGMVITIRSKPTGTSDQDWVLTPVAQRFDPPLTHKPLMVIREEVADIMAAMEARSSNKRGHK